MRVHARIIPYNGLCYLVLGGLYGLRWEIFTEPLRRASRVKAKYSKTPVGLTLGKQQRHRW